jgi:hypothetical protein
LHKKTLVTRRVSYKGTWGADNRVFKVTVYPPLATFKVYIISIMHSTCNGKLQSNLSKNIRVCSNYMPPGYYRF